MRKKFKKTISEMIIAVLCCGLLSGCGKQQASDITEPVASEVNSEASVESKAPEQTTESSSSAIEQESAETESADIESTENIEFPNDYAEDMETGLEIYADASYGDIDGNGIEERIVIRESVVDGFAVHVAFYFNNQRIYVHEDEALCDAKDIDYQPAAYLDLDDDGEKEVFLSFYPHTNGYPLEEYAVVKRVDDKWKTLEVVKGKEEYDNGFPISVIYRNGCELEIKCEGYKEPIAFEGREHYENQKLMYEGNAEYYQGILDGLTFKDGDVCGSTAPWGIWSIGVDEYQGQACLVAEQGIEGEYGKYDVLGEVKVFFVYDELGKAKVLHIDFKEAN